MTSTLTRKTTSARVAGTAYNEWMGVFVVSEQPDAVELLLPYRDEFESAAGTDTIAHGVIAALADATARLLLDRVDAHAILQSLALEYTATARAGNELRSSGRVIGNGIHIRIVTNDDQRVVAQATGVIQSRPATTTTYTAESVSHVLQPIYPN